MKWDKLGRLATRATEGKIMVIKAVWPFNFFPDTIELHEDKLVVIQRTGPWSGQHIPVEYKDLFNIEILEAPIFCTVRVISKYVTGGQCDIPYIKKSDAYKLQDLALYHKKHTISLDQSGGL